MEVVKKIKGYSIYKNSEKEMAKNPKKQLYEIYAPDEGPESCDKPEWGCDCLKTCEYFIKWGF